jgi:hypothetical protein
MAPEQIKALTEMFEAAMATQTASLASFKRVRCVWNDQQASDLLAAGWVLLAVSGTPTFVLGRKD